jgi:hypothetical protein
MVMLMSAGVFLQSVRRAGEIDLGFDRDRLITFELFRVANPRVAETVDRVRALPSVAAVSLADLGIRGGSGASIFLSNGDIIDAMVAPTHGRVDTAYAGVVGLRLLSGRVLSAADANGADPVVMINQATADAYWPNKSAIGDCFVVGRKGDPCRRIVGVVGNVRWDVADVAAKMYYLPKTPSDSGCCRTIIVRTRERATATTINAIRRIVSTVPGTHPEYPPRPRLVAELHEPIMRPWRIAAAMFLVFGMLALAAAGAGIYGLVGYDVTQRTHEFGVRITLGATSSSILRLVIGSGLRVVVFGLVAGAASALAAGRVIASLLFETSPYDPTVLVATTATLSVVALLASLIPAWRATRVDPVVALRAE